MNVHEMALAALKVPKVRDRSGSGVKFNSSIVPPYVRKSPRVSAALPWLYLTTGCAFSCLKTRRRTVMRVRE
jgi:hypothetical protein